MVEWLPEAQRNLQRLDPSSARRVLLKAQWLEGHLGSVQHERLEGPFHNFCKLRAGQYRILYTLNETGTVVRVHLVGHRRDIYKS